MRGMRIVISGEPGWRLRRIGRLLDAAQGAGINQDWIAQVEDWKGYLTISWHEELPNVSHMQGINQLWEALGESANSFKHEVFNPIRG